jgi:hypothetical protein
MFVAFTIKGKFFFMGGLVRALYDLFENKYKVYDRIRTNCYTPPEVYYVHTKNTPKINVTIVNNVQICYTSVNVLHEATPK